MNNKVLISIAQELKPKKFTFDKRLESISNDPFEAHRDKLYHNYVKNYNRMVSLLEKTNFSKIRDNVPNSQFGELQRRVTWAANGAYLHELYFGNIGGEDTKPGKYTLELIKKDFKDLNRFKDYFSSAALVPTSGWAVWGYSLYDNRTQIVSLENHHNNCPIGFYPILVLDMWEHAYWADHFSNKKKYVSEFWKDANWDVVEKRCLLIKAVFEMLNK